jgi:hypothetical protein
MFPAACQVCHDLGAGLLWIIAIQQIQSNNGPIPIMHPGPRAKARLKEPASDIPGSDAADRNKVVPLNLSSRFEW